MEEANQTMWKVPGFWFFLWAFGTPFGALLAGMGILLYSGAKAKRVWLFGIGIFVILVIINLIPSDNHYPPLFGIGGILILLFFFSIVWMWGKKRANLIGGEKIAADLELTGWVFLLVAMWFLCGELSAPFMKAFEGSTGSPIKIMIYLVLGWLFHFLAYKKRRR